jgi:hypothetical protein
MLGKIQNTLYQLTPEDKFFLLLSGLSRTHPIHPSFVVDTNDFICENHLYNVLRGPSRASPPYLLMDFCGSAGCFAPKNICQECGKMKRYFCYPNHGWGSHPLIVDFAGVFGTHFRGVVTLGQFFSMLSVSHWRRVR